MQNIVLINKTQHFVHFMDENENILFSLPPDEVPIRIDEEREFAGNLFFNGVKITLNKKILKDPIGLPPEMENVFYIVSQVTKSELSHRGDLIVPDDLVRDDKGRVIGCKSFSI